jgi:hypothetical protein
VDAAGEWLRDEGYLTALNVQTSGVVRPTITTKGQKVVERGASVNDDPPQAPNVPANITHMTITGSHNTVAAHSPGAVQNVSVTMTEDNRKQVAAVADLLKLLTETDRLGLDDAAAVEAETVVTELTKATEQPSVSSGVLRPLLERAKDVAVSGTGAAMGSGVVALVNQALGVLGLG